MVMVLLIYLNFAKAFDKVRHYKTGGKVEASELRGNLLRWIENSQMIEDRVGISWKSLDVNTFVDVFAKKPRRIQRYRSITLAL